MATSPPHETVRQFNQQVIQLLGDAGDPTPEKVAQLHQLTVDFKTQILPLTSLLDDTPQAAQWLSALTELNRHIRLLSVDIQFWQASQPSPRAQQKLTQISSRLHQIRGFSQVLLELAKACL